MSIPIERRPTLRKAPPADLIGSLTSPSADSTPPARVDIDSQNAAPAATQSAAKPAARTKAATTPARPVGRPRGRRRMEPFSSKIEIDLRDQVDEHVARTGETIIDLLDRALRAALDDK